MNTLTIAQAPKALVAAVENIGGIDAAMAACDRMYSAMFRSEGFKLSEVDDWECEVESIKTSVAIALYSSQEGVTPPQDGSAHWTELAEDMDGEEYDHFVDCLGYEDDAFQDSAERWFESNYPDFVIDGDTLVVDFCNYKGEGEGGVGLYQLNKHLPIFKSKRESFNQINNF